MSASYVKVSALDWLLYEKGEEERNVTRLPTTNAHLMKALVPFNSGLRLTVILNESRTAPRTT